MGDGTDFELDLGGNVSPVAKKMATDLAALEKKLDAVAAASKRTDKAMRPGRTQVFSPDQFRNLQNHANAVVRLRKAHSSLAPASAAAARGLRMFGVHGSQLRRVSIDAAKSEIALRRLYRMKGGGVRGAMGVAGALSQRANLKGRLGGAAMSGLGTMASVAGGATLAVGGAAATGAGLLGFNMAATAIEAQRVKFALDAVTKGDGDKWWATSAEYAKRFGMNVNTVADNMMQMKASQFSDELTKDLFLRTQDMKALGATDESLGRMLLAIRQIKAAGRLQGDELNQLGEAGLDASFVYDALGKKLGKTTAEIIKMKEAGKLSADIVIPAISAAIGAKTGGKAAGAAGEDAASKTVLGQWGRLKGAFSVASTEAIGAGALLPLQNSIASFTAWISGEGGQRAIGAFGGVMTRLFDAAPRIIEGIIWFLDTGLPAAWEAFSSAFASSGGTSAWNSLLSGAETLGGPGGQAVIENITGMATALGNLAGALTQIISLLAPVISGLATVAKYTMIVPTTAVGAVSGFFGGSDAANDNAGAAGAGMSIGQSMAQGLAQGLTMGSPLVGMAAALLGDTANQSLRNQEKVHSPGRRMMEIGWYEAEGFALGMTQRIPSIEEAAGSMGDAASGSVSSGSQSAQGGGTGDITINVYLDGKEVSGKSDGEVGDIIGEHILRKLASALRRAA